ncbi:MAG: DUF1178 family protein [Candidatus Puniceispirillaceae bacterium]
MDGRQDDSWREEGAMIKYQLICDSDHEFEGWFADSAAFESQQKAGYLTCPVCDSVNVRRALMAPNLNSPKTRKDLSSPMPGPDQASRPAAAPATPGGVPAAALPPEAAQKMQALMNEMRALQSKIRDECRDVGKDFAEEARKIHYGEAEPEGIYGQATPEEREALDDEGIDVIDIPWLPKDN